MNTKKTDIEIFRAGTHVGMDGTRYTFSEADVQAIATSYDPALFSAPAVIGHPKSEDPAYGWADAVRVRDDGVMVADLDKVCPAFADLVTSGRFTKVSPAFYPADHPNNPTPGQLYLRHIGFLGAAAPGVRGLAPVEFAEGDDSIIAFASDEELRPIVWLARSVGRMWRRMRDDLIDEKGVEEANKLLPEYEVDAPAEIAAQLDAVLKPAGPRFAEGSPEAPAADAARQAELDRREADLAQREQAQAVKDAAAATAAKQTRAAEDVAFADSLISAGRLAPGHRAEVLGFCAALGASEMIAFSEGEEARDPRKAFQDFLTANLGVSIRFDEVAGGDGLRFAEGQSIDDLTAAIEAEMSSAAAAGHPISAAEASRRAKSRR